MLLASTPCLSAAEMRRLLYLLFLLVPYIRSVACESIAECGTLTSLDTNDDLSFPQFVRGCVCVCLCVCVHAPALRCTYVERTSNNRSQILAAFENVLTNSATVFTPPDSAIRRNAYVPGSHTRRRHGCDDASRTGQDDCADRV